MRNAYQSVALRNRPEVYRDLGVAQRSARDASKASAVIMGAPGEYVVAVLADCERLHRAGFGYAPR